MDRFFRDRARDAFVQRIDRAANCLSAEQQNRRATKDFDAFNGQRVDGDCMVSRCVRCVDIADAVSQYRNAVALIPAQNGARGTGREAGGGYAGQAGENITQLRACFLSQHFARNGRRSGQNIEPLQIGRGHHDFLVGMEVIVLNSRGIAARRALLGISRGCKSDRQGGQADGQSGKRLHDFIG